MAILNRPLAMIALLPLVVDPLNKLFNLSTLFHCTFQGFNCTFTASTQCSHSFIGGDIILYLSLPLLQLMLGNHFNDTGVPKGGDKTVLLH